MARLTSPSGVVVEVSDEKAAHLAAIGYKAEQSEPKAPAKKAASSKSSKN